MKKLMWTVLLACGAYGVAAQGTDSSAGPAATNPAVGNPAEKGAGDLMLAKEFWGQHAQGPSMSREEAMKFKGADGSTVDFRKLDTDGDGKVSEREWTTYHQTAGAAGVPDNAETKPTR